MKTSCTHPFTVLLSLLLLLALQGNAAFPVPGGQGPKASLKQGDTFFKNQKWRDAAASYQAALKENTDKKVYVTRQLAKSYANLFDYQNSVVWYEKLMDYYSDISPQDVLEYAEMLKTLTMYDRAIEIYELYMKKMQQDPGKPSEFKTSCLWAKTHLEDKSDYNVVPTSLQTNGTFLGADFYNNGLMHGSIWKVPGKESFSDLHYSKKMDSATFIYVEKLPGRANGQAHDAHPSLSRDGKTLYFTRNTTDQFYYQPKKLSQTDVNAEGLSLLSIYVSTNTNGEWSEPRRLSFDNKEYSCAYPFIDSDGKTLYFSSNRPGGFGGFDLYKAVLKNDTAFSTPENLGKEINTAGDDFAPRVYQNKFYYASRGKGGFGGADMFVCRLGKDGKPVAPVNMGVPFNSPKDDFYILFMSDGEEGYFASNRDDEHGEDKFYYFRKTPAPPDTVSGIVLDRITNARLKGVTASLYSISSKGDSTLLNTVQSDADGRWLFVVDPAQSYAVSLALKDYYPRQFGIPASSKGKPEARKESFAALKEVMLSPVVKKNNIVKINNIYFDFNKANIRPESYTILNNLLGFMNENPNASIELSAHTDAAGNDNYNLKLSNSRAISCYEYLVGNGISKSRIVPKGYGETKLLNNCKDAKKCSEEENQLNRRVEVKFL